MTNRSIRAKPGPGEELIGTITKRGIRLTREAWRAQRAYRSELQRAARAPRPSLLGWLPRAGTAVAKTGQSAVRRRVLP